MASAVVAILFAVSACANVDMEPSIITPTKEVSPATENPISPTLEPTATITLHQTSQPEPTSTQSFSNDSSYCSIGLGLRRETIDVLLDYRNATGLVQTANLSLAEEYFPMLQGWIRVIGGPSLAVLNTKAARAFEIGLEYEGLSFGLETSESTPDEEWQNLVSSTQKAKDLSSDFGKILVMGPGFRLMSNNQDSYPEMAAEADVWIIQTQRLQALEPGDAYREEVEKLVSLIRRANPDIQVWAQITFPPDRPADAEEWLEFHNAISDIVDGTFIGVYIWDQQNTVTLQNEIVEIFETACKNRDTT